MRLSLRSVLDSRLWLWPSVNHQSRIENRKSKIKNPMPHYLQLGSLPAKYHLQFPREKAASYRVEGLHYEHVITTDGFDRAYTIMYHLRPPTRVRSVELLRQWELK